VASGRLILAAIVGVLATLVPAPADALTATITVTSPVDYRVYQRNGSNQANIAIAGSYTGNPTAIEARWDGGAWQVIDSTLTPTSGTFFGTLTNLPAGQGNLHVRFANLTGLIDTVVNVGIGDIFVMAGQSNMAGRGVANHQYTPPASDLRASLLGNDYKWKEFIDPYDSSVNQVDTVSSDGGTQQGSWLAQFANIHLRNVGVPIAFIPCARGGSTIASWARSTSRSTLYGSCLNRLNVTGGKAKAVLWFQGEIDSNVPIATYRAALNQLADDFASDMNGVPTIPTIIGSAPYAGIHRAGARIGTLQAIEDNDDLLMGPAVYDVNIDDESGDGIHFKSNGDLVTVGTRFWHAVNKNLYGGSIGWGPELQSATLTNNIVTLTFDSDITSSTADANSFWVMQSTTRYPVQSVTISGSTVDLELPSSGLTDLTVSYGHDNQSAIGKALYGANTLPVVPFMDVIVNG
jgi:hypothetical protein